MNKLKILLFIFVLIFLQTKGSSIEKSTIDNSTMYKVIDSARMLAYYDYTFQEDSLNVELIRQNEMLLLIGKRISWFLGYPNYVSTKMIYKNTFSKKASDDLDKRLGFTRTLARYQIYKYHTIDSLTMLIYLNGLHHDIREPLQKMQWKLESGQDTISGYLCKKATTHFAGRDYEAWYTLEIPISDGPYKFNGLPGLIVKIEDTKGEHRFVLNRFEKVQKVEDFKILYNIVHKQVKTDVNGFLKSLTNFNGGHTSINAKNIISGNGPSQSKIAKRLREINNFIEKSEK